MSLPSVSMPNPTATPFCPYFFQCGGCDYQNIDYNDQVIAKDKWLKTLFTEFNTAYWLPFIKSPEETPKYFRNKIRFGFQYTEKGIFLSRHAKIDSAGDITIDHCFLTSPASLEVANFTAHYATQQNWQLFDSHTKTGWLKHIIIRESKDSGQMMLSLVTTDQTIPGQKKWINQVTAYNPLVVSIFQTVTNEQNNAASKDIHLWGDTHLYEKIGNYIFCVSLHAFFQTNGAMVENLYQAIEEILPSNSHLTLWDLYAGSATIGTYLSKKCQAVVSVEANPYNISDAKLNIRSNAITKISLFQGTVEDILNEEFIQNTKCPDVVIIDPPRAGISKKVLTRISNLDSHSLAYVSCNPATCLRDCRNLVSQGYSLKKIQGIDMFPHTHHCEMIVLLEK